MILGGSRYALPIIKAARKLGVYVITCDYLSNNKTRKHSDEYCNASISDKKATLEAAKKSNVDGFTVPTAKGYKNIDEALSDVKQFHWSVIVKPTDSAGSEGVNRIDDLPKVF